MSFSYQLSAISYQKPLIGYYSRIGRKSGLKARILCGLALAGLAGLATAQAPANPRALWRAIIGEYGDSVTRLMVLERNGALIARFDSVSEARLVQYGEYRYRLEGVHSGTLHFPNGAGSSAWYAGAKYPRRKLGPEGGKVFRITPVRPVSVLRQEALAASPPTETGAFRPSELVELVRLDSTIRLDIRYASSRNFLGTPVYTQARAFLQRPAAEALARAHRALRARGYGLLIHDGYRPWYVTKIFWDATPAAQHEFVANPATGSRHNRGCAVDLTLYELQSGRAVEMPGGYDEMSHRSYPGYPGGTSRQRWLRDLLRSALEAEGFTVNESEWWHFDFKDWTRYRLGNTPFERLGPRG